MHYFLHIFLICNNPEIHLSNNPWDDTETKYKNPTTEFVQKTADFFDVPFDQFLAGAEQPRKKPGPVSAIEKRLNQVCSLPPDEQKFVIKFLDQVLASKKIAKTG